MNEPTEPQQELERLLDRTLRGLPLRRAPSTLESRVLDELQRRAALPWWRQSFAHWPSAARAAFVVMGAGLVRLAFLMGTWTAAGMGSLHESAAAMPWARQAVAFVGAAGGFALSLVRAVPPEWVHDGLVVSAVLYAVLFGLGTAAYRVLYRNSEDSGDLKP
jgi:hypothetical protein